MKKTLAALTLAALFSAAPATFAAEPVDPIEPVKIENPALVELGKMLYFEPRLSRSGFISCNSCHNLATGGVDNLKTSIGDRWAQGPINSPTVLNSYGQIAQFWDGRAKTLAEQAAGPIANPLEMASTHELAVEVIACHGSLSTQEQHRVFEESRSGYRVDAAYRDQKLGRSQHQHRGNLHHHSQLSLRHRLRPREAPRFQPPQQPFRDEGGLGVPGLRRAA